MAESKREFTRRCERIEELVSRVENCGDLATRAVAKELLQAVLELHGVALEHILDAVGEIPQGDAALEKVAEDEVVSGVLSLHGIHPIDVETRVQVALESARPYLKSHGGDVELAAIEDGVVHVRLHGSCGSCAGSTETLKNAVEAAVYGAAPEVAEVVQDAMPARAHSDLVILRAG